MEGSKSKTAVLKYLQKQMHSSRPAKNAILAKLSADRQQRMPTGNKMCRPATKCADGNKNQPVASSHCRWCVGMPHKAFPAPPRQNTSVWCKTRHKTVESRDPEARRVAETSGNSRRTQTWMITECSNGDVQVLRTVKNGVSTAVCQA